MCSEPLQTISINSNKVWLVGDIHGQYQLLMEQLSKHQFDPQKGHILVSVGDLIDRGPDSVKTLELLNESWFYAVMGNHEQMLLKGVAAYEGKGPNLDILNWQNFNGGEWYNHEQASENQVDMLIQKIRQLPLAIEIQTEQGRVGVIHAAVPNNQWLDKNLLNNELVKKHLLWFRGNGRSVIDMQHRKEPAKWDSQAHTVAGIDRVVVGHTIMPNGKPIFVGNTLYLDVGAALGVSPVIISAAQLFSLQNSRILDKPSDFNL